LLWLIPERLYFDSWLSTDFNLWDMYM
jgi:hypothetical protein